MAYNRTVHSTTSYSPFEITYSFNPLTPLDLVPLPSNEQINLDGAAKAKYVRDLHEKVRLQIIKKNEHYARNANQGRRRVTFEPGDWVWVHMRKERFPAQRKSKLHPRGDGPFQVVARIGDNAYKIDLPGDYGVSVTFNVSDLSPFEFDAGSLDSRMSPFEEGGTNEETPHTPPQLQGKLVDIEDPVGSKSSLDSHGGSSTPSPFPRPLLDPLQGIGGPMMRARAKKMQSALNQLIIDIHGQEEARPHDLHYHSVLVLQIQIF